MFSETINQETVFRVVLGLFARRRYLAPTSPKNLRFQELQLLGLLPYNINMTAKTTTTSRTARIEARIAPELLATVKRAAELQGRSVSDFVVTATLEAANKTISETNIIRLSREASEQLAELLINPPAPTDALRSAFAARRRLIAD
jgi:uncharacterized protein (DUF1778 family)